MPAMTGLPQLEKQLRDAIASKKKLLERGLVEAGKLLLAESKKEVPIDFGQLTASGFVRIERAASMATNPLITVGYTDPKSIWVHENLEAAHGEEWNVKHAKDLANFQNRQKAVNRSTRQAKAGLLSATSWAARKAFVSQLQSIGDKRASMQASPYRHERGAGQKAKFLEGPFRRMRKELVDMVKSYL